MKIARIIGCVVGLIAAVYLLSCSAGTGSATNSQPSSESSRIHRLEQIYANPQSSELERLNAASELVRLGVSNPKYWTRVQREGRTAIQREQSASNEFKKQQRVEYAGDAERLVANRDAIADASLVATAGSSTTTTAKVIRTKVTGYTENGTFVAREPDLSNLSGVMALAASKHPDALPSLRRAVKSDNVMIAAEGALGLANLKDHQSVPLIVQAAERFDEGFLFARALVYFGTTNANDEADRLLRDKPKLLRELKATAQARGFEPYGSK